MTTVGNLGRTEVRLSRNPRHRRSSACPRLCTTTRPVPGGLRSRKTGLAPGLGHEFWWVIYLLKKRNPTRPPLLNETVPSHSAFVTSIWNFWTKSRSVLRWCPVPLFVSRPTVRVPSHCSCPVPRFVSRPNGPGVRRVGQTWTIKLGAVSPQAVGARHAHSGREGEPGKS
jgi:hypothetical protein